MLRMMMTAFVCMLGVCWAERASAQDRPPSPANEVYQVGGSFAGARVAYRVSFDESGALSVKIGGTYPPPASGTDGQWVQDVDGAVTITGEDLPLIASGDNSVRCDAWPVFEVGEYFDEPPCWWTGVEPSGLYQRVE